MNNVIELKREVLEEVEMWAQGSAMCIGCGHKWEAAAPVGSTVFECPNCHTNKGTWVSHVEPPGERWECNCEGQLFFVTHTGFFCAKCGVEQKF